MKLSFVEFMIKFYACPKWVAHWKIILCVIVLYPIKNWNIVLNLDKNNEWLILAL